MTGGRADTGAPARLRDEQAARIAAALVARLDPRAARAGQGAADAAPHAAHAAPRAAHGGPGAPPPQPEAVAAAQTAAEFRDGLFPDAAAAVAAARIAQRRLSAASLETRAGILAAMRAAALREAEALAVLAHEETGYGRAADKLRKNRLAARKTPGLEQLASAALSGDRGLTLTEPAPYGVIAAITPVTNATSTIICNAIGMVAAGNSVVFNAHPSARRCGNRTVQLLNQAIMGAGGPANLVTAVAAPSIASAQALMRHPDVRLLVVTGGGGVVGEALRSGKRAICAGPGNPPVVVDETADIEQAGRDIVLGASFDNNIICVDEKEVFVVAAVADALLRAMKRHGAYLLDGAEMQRLERLIFERGAGPRQPAVVRQELIGRDAADILARAGIRVGPEIRLAVAEVPAAHPLVWTEQMLPVLPVVRVASADQGIDLALQAERGCGHTAAMHSRDLGHLSRMAREVNCSIFVKNGPCYAGLGEGGEGFCSFTIASPTGEGLTGPVSFARQRRCVLVDHFRIV